MKFLVNNKFVLFFGIFLAIYATYTFTAASAYRKGFTAGTDKVKARYEEEKRLAVQKVVLEYEHKLEEHKQLIIEKEQQEELLSQNLEDLHNRFRKLEVRKNVKAFLDADIPDSIIDELHAKKRERKDNKSKVPNRTNKT